MKKSIKREENHAKSQAEAQLHSIIEMVENLEKAEKEENDTAREQAEQTIHEDALSVQVRSGWYEPGSEETKPAEYEILLCWGSPACRIIGELDQYGQPETARIEYQDWGTPWTEYPLTGDQERIIIKYANCFYFAG